MSRTPDADALARAPWVAMDYHAGQTCPLYAYGSTGSMVAGLSSAAEWAAELADRSGLAEDAEALRALALAAEMIGENDE